MPIHTICGTCQKDYSLKDQFAGKKVRCTECGNVFVVPEADEVIAAGFAPVQPGGEEIDYAFQRDKFLMRQKHFAINEKYEVWDEDGEPVLFVERPAHLGKNLVALLAGLGVFLLGIAITIGICVALSNVSEALAVVAGFILGLGSIVAFIAVFIRLHPKRHINFYADRDKREQLLEVLQDKKVMLLTATYTCLDAEGNCLGSFRKNYLYDIFRKRWEIYGPEGDLIAVAKEDSIILSLLRRIVPPILLALLRTNFIILTPNEEDLGEFNRKFTLLDRYVLDMSRDRAGRLDRRLAVALGILLDTGERR